MSQSIKAIYTRKQNKNVYTAKQTPRRRPKNNSVHPTKTLLELIKNRRSRAYRQLSDACVDENGFQSDEAAGRLRNDLESTVRRLLTGDFDAAKDKINSYPMMEAPITISRTARTRSHAKKVRVGSWDAYVETEGIVSAPAEQFVYGLLRRALESGDIKHLAVCRTCNKIYYRKSAKGEACSDLHVEEPLKLRPIAGAEGFAKQFIII